MKPKFSPALFRLFAKQNFVVFVEKAFQELSPETGFLPNWHVKALVYMLEQIMAGRSMRLIVNLPPQFLKSIICSVALPAFILGIDPTKKILCASYSQPLAEHLHSSFRRIVESPWYREMFHPNMLRSTASEFETRQGGYRIATSVNGTLTGLGADLIIVDDPLNAGEAHLKSARDGANKWCTVSLISRLSNKNTGAIIVVAQRLHPEDLSGYLLERGGWDHFCLPAIAPRDRSITLLGGRTHVWKTGEALHPELLGLAVLAKLKDEMGADNFSAQYLQEPQHPSGNLLKIEWLRTCDSTPAKAADDFIVQSWDTAFTTTLKSDFSVCLTLLARKNEIYLLDVLRARLDYPDLVRQVLDQANKHQPNVILIEDVGSGASLSQTLKKDHGLSDVIACKPDQDKQTRIIRHTHTLAADPLFVPRCAAWLDDFRAEFLGFPHVRHDDQIDALSQFYGWYETHRRRTLFSFDFGFGGDDTPYRNRLGAPSADEMRGVLGR